MEQKDEFIKLRREKRKKQKIARKLRIKNEVKTIENYIPRPNNKKLKLRAIEKIKSSPLLIIDSSFEKDVDEKTLKSLMRQYAHINALMKKNDKIFRVELTGIESSSKEILKEYLADRWIVPCFKEQYLEKFSKNIITDSWGNKVQPYECPSQPIDSSFKDKLVYLTGDATEEMTELDER